MKYSPDEIEVHPKEADGYKPSFLEKVFFKISWTVTKEGIIRQYRSSRGGAFPLFCIVWLVLTLGDIVDSVCILVKLFFKDCKHLWELIKTTWTWQEIVYSKHDKSQAQKWLQQEARNNGGKK